jgi:hypothetical protein
MVTWEAPLGEGPLSVRIAPIAQRPGSSMHEGSCAAAAERTMTAYRAWARESFTTRIRARAMELWAAYDEEPGPARACVMRVLSTRGQARLILWELPPADSAGPYVHHLGEAGLLLVLDGRPTLSTPEGRRELQRGEAAALLPSEDSDRRLLNDGNERVRFLALSAGRHSNLAA